MLRPTRHYPSAEMVWASVLKVCRAEASLLRARQRGGLQRGLMAWALQRDAGLTQRQIAARLGLSSGAAVCWMLRRVGQRAAAGARPLAKWQHQLNLLLKG